MSDVKALISKLNPTCKRALESAAELCLAQTHFSVEIEHFLLKLVERPDGDLPRVLRYYEIDAGAVAQQLSAAIEKLKRGNSRTPSLSPHLLALFEGAWVTSSLRLGQPAIRSGAVLHALLEDDALRALLLEAVPLLAMVPRGRLAEDLPELVHGSAEDPAAQPAASSSGSAHSHAAPTATPTPALDAYTIDLSAEAAAGRIDPIIGRDAEIRQIVDVLMRRRQNNPILTGEAGVGKTAVVEGFAQRIASGDVPPPLRDVRVCVLDVGLMQAGASMKGEFEQRLRSVIDEAQSSPKPVILFIDEAHTLIGAGGQAGTGDAANLLKPALARGTLRTIAATTWSEYRQYFEKDPALARRFQPIHIGEPDVATAVVMLRGLVAPMEKHHKVRVSDEAIVAAVNFSQRYIPARQLPDKAVSLLDTACARVAISQTAKPAAVEDSEVALRSLESERQALLKESDLSDAHGPKIAEIEEKLAKQKERGAALDESWGKEKALVKEILDMREKIAEAKGETDIEADRAALREKAEALGAIKPEERMIYPHVDEAAVAAVVSDWTGIPVGRMMADEVETVLNLAEILNRRIVGQSHGLEMIARRIETNRARLDNPSKPIGVFLLCGPSGVGKTETALALAESLYGGEQNIITINMSEFQEAHTVATLKGAPPGYVGYGEGGRLTEAVRRRPYSVVLLDEIEKAHPDVHEIFFQVFDKGVMEDGSGRRIDFRNTLILLTSNVGTEMIMDAAKRSSPPDAATLAVALKPALLEVFPPALLGRVVTIPYYPLSPAMLTGIVKLHLKRIAQRIADHHKASFTADDSAIELIVSMCNDPDSGGRVIDNIITNTILPALSREILKRTLAREPIQAAKVLVENGAFAYDVS
ncbi:MAG TPA: type VI secretion system ATPase TssH [Stellaceae bacterium]|nr:type VI secretion system ATPase TssH [Stellaceae bacterium]